MLPHPIGMYVVRRQHPYSTIFMRNRKMTKEELIAFRNALAGLSPAELYALREGIDEKIAENYYSDENFSNREKKDDCIYIIVYKDLSCYHDFIGKRAYEKYMHDKDAIRIEAKTKNLFPDYKVLCAKGELTYEQARVRH